MMTTDGRQVVGSASLGGGWFAYQFQDGTFALDNAERGIRCDLSAMEADQLHDFMVGEND